MMAWKPGRLRDLGIDSTCCLPGCGLCNVAGLMNVGQRYFQLSRLGRETFLESVALGALVRTRELPKRARGSFAEGTGPGDTTIANIGPVLGLPPARRDLEIYPLAKRPGTPFVDLITVGRTGDNDLQLDDMSVSRFHAFFRLRHGRWFVCDAGSSNGTRIGGKILKPRTELEIRSDMNLHFGLIALTFYVADALFDVLNSSS